MSAVRDCLFNIFAGTLHIGGRSSVRNVRTRHAVVTGSYKHFTKFQACSNSRTSFDSQYRLTCLRGTSASNCATNRKSLPLLFNSFNSVLFGHTQEILVTNFLSPVGRLVLRGTEPLRFCEFIKFLSNSAPNAMYLEDFTVKRSQKLLSKQIRGILYHWATNVVHTEIHLWRWGGRGN